MTKPGNSATWTKTLLTEDGDWYSPLRKFAPPWEGVAPWARPESDLHWEAKRVAKILDPKAWSGGAEFGSPRHHRQIRSRNLAWDIIKSLERNGCP
jgi:hypothetical protein